MPEFDVVGVGLNATDILILTPRVPPYSGKAPYEREVVAPGGQVASALVACARLGLRTSYIGAVGDDEKGRIQLRSLAEAGVDTRGVKVRPGCDTQSAYIIVDGASGERTVFWRRDDRLAIAPDEISRADIAAGRLLHIDGHDTPSVERSAALARELGIPVTVDVDTIYPGFDRVLPLVDYLVASSEFPGRWTGEPDPFRALEKLQDEYGMKVAAMTLGAHGALAREGQVFHYAPAFAVDAVDTTGAGDVFHGAFCYAVLQGMRMRDALEFSNAMAALNCMALGARGGIRGLEDIRELISRGERRPHPDFASRAAAFD